MLATTFVSFLKVSRVWLDSYVNDWLKTCFASLAYCSLYFDCYVDCSRSFNFFRKIERFALRAAIFVSIVLRRLALDL